MTASSTKKLIAFTQFQDTGDKQNLKQIYLPCPRTGKPTIYFCDGTHLYELQKVTGAGRKTSWLVDNYLYEDGACYCISLIDPLFIAIPLLDKARQQNAESQGKFRTTDDIFSPSNKNDDEETATYPQSLLNIHDFEAQLAHVCDSQEVAPGLRVHRLNDAKTLEWLTKKVDRIAACFLASPPRALDFETRSLPQEEKQGEYNVKCRSRKEGF
ncbi:Ydr279p protein family-domain-containing protein [Dichotomocladium elegans]|nr:Ydr279p protein family-domain-containing protein [Dichotomocladium elegans]